MSFSSDGVGEAADASISRMQSWIGEVEDTLHPSVPLVQSRPSRYTADSRRSSSALSFVTPEGWWGAGGAVKALTGRSVSVIATFVASGVPVTAKTARAVSALFSVSQQVLVADSDCAGTRRKSVVDVKLSVLTVAPASSEDFCSTRVWALVKTGLFGVVKSFQDITTLSSHTPVIGWSETTPAAVLTV